MICYMEKKECRVYFLLFPVVSFPLKSSESHVKLRTKFKRTLYDKMTELLFKVIIVGDATVGKTSFVRRYVSNHPGREYKPTQGGRALEEFVNHSTTARDLQILLAFYQHPACFISL